MKKFRLFLVLFCSFLCGITFLPSNQNINATVGDTISQNFPDANMAQAVADLIAGGDKNAIIIPAMIASTTELTVSNKNISNIEGIQTFTQLTKFEAPFNQITSLPDSIGDLTKLTTLNLDRNNLTSIPSSIGNLSNLVELFLSGNKLVVIPDSIGNLSNLSWLQISENQLTDLPESIGNLSKLGRLFAYSNKITSLPDSIGNLKELGMLRVRDNYLTTLPSSVSNLSNLWQLDVASNNFISLPEAINGTNQPKLTDLIIDNNGFKTFPQSLTSFKNLNYFVGSENEVIDLNDTTYTYLSTRNSSTGINQGGSLETNQTFPLGTSAKITNGLPIMTQVKTYTQPITYTYTLVAPDGTQTQITPLVDPTTNEITINYADIKMAGKYTLRMDVTSGFLSGSRYTETFAITDIRTKVPVKKVWIGPIKEGATINLLADGVIKQSFNLTAQTSWEHIFDNLPQYSNDKKIVYSISEDSITNYQSDISGDAQTGYTVKNTNVEKWNIPVQKNWVDNNSVNRPTSVTVNLLADGTIVNTKQISSADSWQSIFAGFPKYDAVDGHEIEYKVSEDTVAGYSTGFSGTAENGFTVTNTIAGKVSIPVTKIWQGPAKNSVNVHLYANGQEVASQILNEANEWQYTFIDFDEYDNNGVAIDYTIKEDEILNYSTDITGDLPNGYTITNANDEKVNIKGVKHWADDNSSLRPSSVIVYLYADGQLMETRHVSANDNWQFEFTELLKYDRFDAHEFKYTIKEEPVANYESLISGSIETGFTITNTIKGKISIPVIKYWKGSAKNSIMVRLYGNDKQVSAQELSRATRWQHIFSNLEKYDKNGKEINYRISEDSIAGYRTEIVKNGSTGFKITNIATNETSVKVKKVWYGTIQKEVKINLLKNNHKITSLTLNKRNNWQGIFKGLPKLENGKEVKYTIAEERISGYRVRVTGDSTKGYVITNTQTIPKSGSTAINLFLSGLLCGIIGILALSAVKNKY